jgi:biopolymer transport protein ExbD
MGKKLEMVAVEVDMVPLIDIISLVLMFLIMVGDMSKSSSSVAMKLPRASESKSDKDVVVDGRIVVQLKEEKPEGSKKYKIVIDSNSYEMAGGGNGTLLKYFDEQIKKRVANGMKLGKSGEAPIPIKLRIPANAPMSQVQQVITNIAAAKLTNVQYAVDNKAK